MNANRSSSPRRLDFLLVALLLCAPACLGCDSKGGGVIAPVKQLRDLIVELALQVGETVEERAAALSQAIKTAWRKMFPEVVEGVEVSKDPLRGRLKGDMRIKVIERRPDGSTLITIDITIADPPMRRDSPDSTEWQLDETAPELARIFPR